MVDDAKPAFDVVGTSKVLARIGSKFGLVTFLVSVIAAIGFEENVSLGDLQVVGMLLCILSALFVFTAVKLLLYISAHRFLYGSRFPGSFLVAALVVALTLVIGLMLGLWLATYGNGGIPLPNLAFVAAFLFVMMFLFSCISFFGGEKIFSLRSRIIKHLR